MKKGERITLSKALASAGGLMVTAKAGSAAILRQDANGKAMQVPVNISKVLRGQAEDLVLAQNDVLFVPGSTTKTIARGFLGGLSGVLAALVYVGF